MDSLPRGFYSRDSAEVARDILGKVLVRGKRKGKITEAEAYYGKEDPASHASNGKTGRNEVMFGGAGLIYVYLCYGLHHLLNITTRKKGKPGAVLIRSLKPLEGLDEMKKMRQTTNDLELTTGPGRLTEALGIDGSFNGLDITDRASPLGILNGEVNGEIQRSPRIGVEDDRKLRFYLGNSDYVS